jgi:hypothetical protein
LAKREMQCRAPGCRKKSKGPRFHFMCDEHKKLPQSVQISYLDKWNKKHKKERVIRTPKKSLVERASEAAEGPFGLVNSVDRSRTVLLNNIKSALGLKKVVSVNIDTDTEKDGETFIDIRGTF